jgi:acyl-CoA synthetase (AMP-forming)/AMP-acid ligase II
VKPEPQQQRDPAETIVHALVQQAALRPSRAAFTVIDLQGRATALCYGELLERGLRLATALRERGLHQGDRVLICLPTCSELVVAIYGVMLAGGVCVPLYPQPSLTRGLARWKERILAVSRIAQPCGAVVAPEGRLHLASTLEQVGEGLFAVTPAQLEEGVGTTGAAAPVRPEDLAFIQFTSGTTRQPRGVSVTHAALMANIEALVTGMGLGPADRSVSWLPPYHDMGLVGHIFTPVCCAVHQHLMPPQRFLEQPARWLELIGQVRATQTTAPNSAYSMCVTRIPQARRRGLELGTLRWALNGAELVLAETLDRFSNTFADAGFERAAFRPVYGLAEATLAATFSSPNGGPRVDWVDRHHLAAEGMARPMPVGAGGAQAFVSVGAPIPGHELKLVNHHRPCAEREVGEIWFRGPSVMRGYFNNPSATIEVLRDGWLRTGDLGYSVGGALHVTGRRKELIIKRGRNYQPQDFEAACLEVPELRPGRTVAFGASNSVSGTEDIVLVAEVRDPARAADPQLVRRVISVVGEHTGLPPDRVELLQPGVLPKTTSGKLQRGKVRAAYESGVPLDASNEGLVETLTEGVRSVVDLALARVRRILGWQ